MSKNKNFQIYRNKELKGISATSVKIGDGLSVLGCKGVVKRTHTPAPPICANSYKYKHECGEPWDGEGLPPVGTEVRCNDELLGEVEYVKGNQVVVNMGRLEVYRVEDLSPSMSKEEISRNIAIDEDQRLVLEALDCLTSELFEGNEEQVILDLLKAGYRKQTI